MNFSKQYLSETSQIASSINPDSIELMVDEIDRIRKEKGRFFFIGVGGSSANASHAVNDFRKLCELESYCLTDNIAELTARTNDDGWESTFKGILKVAKLKENDCIFVLSVGGGNLDKKISVNICSAIDFAKSIPCKILGIVGREEGYLQSNADRYVQIPIASDKRITPHSESFQLELVHLMVSHPKLAVNKTTW